MYGNEGYGKTNLQGYDMEEESCASKELAEKQQMLRNCVSGFVRCYTEHSEGVEWHSGTARGDRQESLQR